MRQIKQRYNKNIKLSPVVQCIVSYLAERCDWSASTRIVLIQQPSNEMDLIKFWDKYDKEMDLIKFWDKYDKEI